MYLLRWLGVVLEGDALMPEDWSGKFSAAAALSAKNLSNSLLVNESVSVTAACCSKKKNGSDNFNNVIRK